ncbi:unnamed protein product [Calypogeia fissa]
MTGGVVTNSALGRSLVPPRSPCLDGTTFCIGSRLTVKRCVKVFAREGPAACSHDNGATRRGRCFGRRSSYSSRGSNRSLGLQSSLTCAWEDSRMCSKVLLQLIPSASGEHHAPRVVDDLGGQYEESFDDVQKHLLDYFTYKAVRTVLAQLSEMNPHQYAWFYNFVVNNKPQDSKLFLRLLVKERQELGERVMVTRLHLFNKWVKKYNHAQLHKAISDQNLELLRERLIQTVKFTNSIGDDIETTPP